MKETSRQWCVSHQDNGYIKWGGAVPAKRLADCVTFHGLMHLFSFACITDENGLWGATTGQQKRVGVFTGVEH